ncbi:MAG: IS21 family transposase [Candidatus Cloacimonetes bacterium]|nr:IS21 family transposase [Candidatus Cloacimonadota bacterium]
MNLEQFKKMKELKALGLSRVKTASTLELKEWEIRKYWNMTEDEFRGLQQEAIPTFDKYKDFVVNILKVTPMIPDRNVMFKLKEAFPDFDISTSAFYRYIKSLREEHGFDKFKKRNTVLRQNPEPGEEAQVDFGQDKIIDMYGINRRIYFFVMVLKYSKLMYVYFSSEPFTTVKSIEAHKYAFRFFGGYPKNIVYDQDRVFVVHENFGNIILVKEFEDYVKDVGFSVVVCSGYHPESKGTVENYVKIVKSEFLLGRVYTCIDCLNSSCLEWLDHRSSDVVHSSTGKTARELFMKEANHLTKIAYNLNYSRFIYTVDKNVIKYQYSMYEIPLGFEGDKVLVEVENDELLVKNPITKDVICKHTITNARGSVVKLKETKTNPSVGEVIVLNHFNHDALVMKYLSEIREKHPRYYSKSCNKLQTLIKQYSKEQLKDAMEYCLSVGDVMLSELASYLIYKYGEEIASRCHYKSLFEYYKKRAKEIEVLLNG